MDEVPEETIERVETLIRRARDAVDTAEAEAYRAEVDELLAEHGFTWRIREEEARDVLVVHPADWVEDGTIQVDRIENIDRAVERQLDGAGDPDDWDAVDAHNREIAELVREAHGPVHGANADAFADFMSNHYAKPVETASRRERTEFLEEYFPRNAWPSTDQKSVVERSISLVFEAADEPL